MNIQLLLPAALLLAVLVPAQGQDSKPPLLKASKEAFRYKGGVFAAKTAEEKPGVLAVSFPSPIASGHASNDTVAGWLFTPPNGKAVAAVIFLPGWKSGLVIEQRIASSLAGRGFEVLLLLLPYQGARAPEGIASDEYTLSGNLDRNEQGLVQAVHDVQRAAEWLRVERKIAKGRIGLCGLSLGGYVGSVVHSVSDDFSAAAFLLSGGQIADVLWNDVPLMAEIRADLKKQGYTAAKLRERVKRLDPLSYAGPAKGRKVLLVASSEDEIVPKGSVEALSKAYGGAPVTWMKGSHVQAVMQLPGQEAVILGHFEKALGK